MAILAGYDGDVYVAAVPSITVPNPTNLTDTGDHQTYTSGLALDDSVALTVQTAASGAGPWTTVTNYTVQWPAGIIFFNTPNTPGTNATVRIIAGSYYTTTSLDGAHTWSLTFKGSTVKTTAFQPTNQWETETATVRAVSGQVTSWRTDNRLMAELAVRTVMTLWVSRISNIRWVMYANVTGVDPKTDVGSVDEQTLSFTATGPAYFLTT